MFRYFVRAILLIFWLGLTSIWIQNPTVRIPHDGMLSRCDPEKESCVLEEAIEKAAAVIVDDVLRTGCDPEKESCVLEEPTEKSAGVMKDIVYLEHNHFNSQRLHLAGLLGECSCSIRGVKPTEVSTLNDTTTGAIIFNFAAAKDHIELLDQLPQSITKILFWREAYYGRLPPNVQNKFDFIMGTHFTDALMNPCHFGPGFNTPRDEILPIYQNPFSNRTRFAALISSNCGAFFRNWAVKELQKYFPVDVYGKCTDKTYDLQVPPKHSGPEKMKAFYSNFKFVLAVENTDSDGYVSEKLFKGLGSGAVPIYFGAKDIEHFPKLDGNTEWFISYRDFKTVQQLARYVLKVADDEELHRKYLQWHDYAESGGIWMPNATQNMKDCFERKTKFPSSSVIEFRHDAVCSLCQQARLEELKQRGVKVINL